MLYSHFGVFDTPHRYVIADTRFHHANIIAYCGRPFRDAEIQTVIGALDQYCRMHLGQFTHVFFYYRFGLKRPKKGVSRPLLEKPACGNT